MVVGKFPKANGKIRIRMVALPSCRKYEYILLSRPDLMCNLNKLSGRTLGGWCKSSPRLCHGDGLVYWADFDGSKV